MADHVGQRLGHYRLMRLLGHGGFADVYLGEHMLLGTTIAVKLLHTQVSSEDTVQFQQEARILASLKHPHIVRVLDFGIEEQTPYLVMEYAPNGTLRTRHSKGTMLPVATVAQYVKQVAQALQYAHERKIVHRDIKPENMLIGEQNQILLSDFGIALIAQSSLYQSTKEMVGTVAYMSPEQIAGHPRTASDQYSLATVAYEWLCGTSPFHGSFTEIAIQHSVTPPTSLCQHVPALSPHVEHVVLTALAKRPEDRFASVNAFANAFEQASRGHIPPQRVHPVSPSSPSPFLVNVPTPLTLMTTPASLPHHLTGAFDMHSTPANQFASIPGTSVPPHLPMPARTTGDARVSRRAVLIGAGIVVTAAVGAGGFVALHTWFPTTPQYQSFVYRGHASQSVASVAWSPDGKRMASGSFDKTVQLWNPNDGGNVFTYTGHSSRVWSVAWSPDGRRIASSSRDKTVQVWNASDGYNVFTYKGHSDAVDAVAWSPDGVRIASSSRDKTVQVWNANDGYNIFTYKGHSDAVNAVGWSPDGVRIASGSNDKTVQVWNGSDGSKVFIYKGHTNAVRSVAWSCNGLHLASSSDDTTVQLWNASSGSKVLTYKGHAAAVYAIAWSPDGKRIASGSDDNTVQVWNTSDGSKVFTYTGHINAVRSVAWSRDGKRIASGSDDYTVQVWSQE